VEEAYVVSFRDLSLTSPASATRATMVLPSPCFAFGYIDRLSPATRSVTSLGSNIDTCEQYNACTHGMPTIAPQLGIAAQAVRSRVACRVRLSGPALRSEFFAATEAGQGKVKTK
jgi:hypothetical protein